MHSNISSSQDTPKTGLIYLSDGSCLYGYGFGKEGKTVAEICFNTSMTGYQEILTDPSYASQIIAFTMPHIGNVGTNSEDYERQTLHAGGIICRNPITSPSNWRATTHFDKWAHKNDLVGVYGIDTRALAMKIRNVGSIRAVLVNNPKGDFDLSLCQEDLKNFQGLEGQDLASRVTIDEPYKAEQNHWGHSLQTTPQTSKTKYHIVAIDYGMKDNILHCLHHFGFTVQIVPAKTSAEEILSYNPDGVFLSNGPGDPVATAAYTVPVIQEILQKKIPLFGICLGHQLLALALGAKTSKMKFGHHGGNHPVQNIHSKKVEIVSMNHNFVVDRDTLPNTLKETHISLFDDTNCGIQATDYPAFSVQFHPEASPGPQDSYYLFEAFHTLIANQP